MSIDVREALRMRAEDKCGRLIVAGMKCAKRAEHSGTCEPSYSDRERMREQLRCQSPTCTLCGKNEGDGIGIVVGGVCGDCRGAW